MLSLHRRSARTKGDLVARSPSTKTLATKRRATKASATKDGDKRKDPKAAASSRSSLVDMASRCLCFRARRAARLITRDYDAALAPTGLKATQLTLLCAVELRDDLGMGELADVLGLEQSTLSRNVAVLRERGFLRVSSGEDKRQRALRITSKGRALVEKAYPLWQQVQRETEARYLTGASRFLLGELDEQAGLRPGRS